MSLNKLSNVSNPEVPSASELSSVLLALSRLAQQPDIENFQAGAVALLRQHVPFDGCMWAAATLVEGAGRLHHAYTWRLRPDAMELMNDSMEGNVVGNRCVASPGIAHVFDLDTLRSNATSAFVTRQMGMEQVLAVVTMERSTQLMGSLSVTRRQARPVFSERERRWVELLMPHLQEMLSVCRLAHLQAARGQRLTGNERMAIADVSGVLQVTEAGFIELLREEWSGWMGPYLPPSLCVNDDGDTEHRAGELWIRVGKVAGNLIVRLRRRSALDRLSPQERATAMAYAEGRSHKEVARVLGLAPATVRHHLRHVYAKLGVDDKAALARHLEPADVT